MKKSLLVAAALGTCFVFALLAQEGKQAQRTDQEQAKPQVQQPQQMKLSGDMAKDMRMMNEMMVQKLGDSDQEYEKRFIDMMIPHHEGAILMAKDALKDAKRKEIRDMAEEMIKTQQEEIKKLKQLRATWYGKED